MTYNNECLYIKCLSADTIDVDTLTANHIIGPSIAITDANGISVISDGAFGTNPVNKTATSITNAFYDRNQNGYIILNGADPPAGLSNIAPFGVVNNSANFTTLTRKITTINNSSATFLSFPSNAGNKQSYGLMLMALGTSSVPVGETMLLNTKTSFYFATAPAIIPLAIDRGGSGPLLDATLQITYDGTYFNASVIGVNGYTIQWIITAQFTQYRVSA